MSCSITKTCNKCKKALSVEVFGDNGRGECFKNCDACRSRGRDEQARSIVRNKEAKSNASPVVADVVKADELVDSTVISLSNRNLFVRGLYAYIVQELPDVCLKFGPPSGGHCITIFLNERVRLSIHGGCTWGEIQELIRVDIAPKARLAAITDDTVCDEKNITSFVEKIAYLSHEEVVSEKKCYDQHEAYGYRTNFRNG